MSDDSAARLHADSLVIDGVCPLPMNEPAYLEWYKGGGVTALGLTVGSSENARSVLNRIAMWHRVFRERTDLQMVRSPSDIALAKRNSKLGVYLHIQGTDPIERNLDLIDLYKALGVGIMQLTYNVRNHVGDGCEEPNDSGLSQFGAKVIDRLNEAKVIVDCSHTGFRTSMEAIERSRAPVVLSHSNVLAIHQSARNVSEVLIDAIARSGGLVGLAGFPGMVAATSRPTVDQFIAHIDAIVQRVGIDHVALGIDYYRGQAGVATDEEALRNYKDLLRAGTWGLGYPPPPHHYPESIETPRTLQRLTARLVQHGYGDKDIRKVLGQNWIRVMERVWN